MLDATLLKAYSDALVPLLSIVFIAICSIVGNILQLRASKKQQEEAYRRQLEMLEENHRRTLEAMKEQHRRDDTLRSLQNLELDYADRQVILEYIDLLVPRLYDISSIYWLAETNTNPDELKRYQNRKKYMQNKELHPSFPESNLGMRITFLYFQLLAAIRIATNARWKRPMTADQKDFLNNYELHIEPVMCSARYPGKELLYREQIEVICNEMLITPSSTNITRPLDWSEFCRRLTDDKPFHELAEMVAEKIRFIFDEKANTPPRKAMQIRMAILALYLIDMSKEAGSDIWEHCKDTLWDVIRRWYAWEVKEHQDPEWYVFEECDTERDNPYLDPINSNVRC